MNPVYAKADEAMYQYLISNDVHPFSDREIFDGTYGKLLEVVPDTVGNRLPLHLGQGGHKGKHKPPGGGGQSKNATSNLHDYYSNDLALLQ